MNELLLEVPVHVLEIGHTHSGRINVLRALHLNLEPHIIGAFRVLGVSQISQRLGVHLRLARARGAAEVVQGVQRHHPGRDGRREVLRGEGAQRNILPRLHVARRPVVHHHHAEDAVLGLCHGQRATQSIGVAADEEGHLKLVVQQSAGSVGRALGGVILVHLQLTAGTHHIAAVDHHRRRAPVVAHRQVQPVGLQSVVLAAEHDAHVRRVLARTVEVRVVTNGSRHVHHNVFHGNQGSGLQFLVGAKSGVLAASR